MVESILSLRKGIAVADAKELIGSILSSPRLAKSHAFSDQIYEDEPILFTGSQMRNFLPSKYRQMKALAKPELQNGEYRRPSGTQVFLRQARFMEDWEDDFPFKGTFKRYFPTYAMMNDQQLRGYFTWRTKVRNGSIEPASLSFAYVYIYELLNGIGASSPQESFDKLYAFWQESRHEFGGLDAYVPTWLRDLAIYHALPASLFEKLVDLSFEQSLIALKDFERAATRRKGAQAVTGSDGGLWDAISVLSAYDLGQSSFLTQNKGKAMQVVSQVLQHLSRHYAKNRKKGLTESWFGSPQVSEHFMFPSAVFLDDPKHPDCRYDVNAVHSYTCKKGRWYALRRYKKAMPNEDLGALLKAVELAMRAEDPANADLSAAGVPKYQASMIRDAVRAVAATEAEKERRQVKINRSSLAGIRLRAAGTREQLLTEEERMENPVLSDSPVSGDAAPAPADKAASGEPACVPEADQGAAHQEGAAQNAPAIAPSNHDSPEQLPYALTEGELSFLEAIIEGNRSPGIDEDLLADAVNEKLFDLVGDTVLEFGADGLTLVEDYREEVEGAVLACKKR